MPSSFVIIIELKQGGDSNGSLMREILPKAVRLTRKQGGYIVNRKLLSLFMAIVMTLSCFPPLPSRLLKLITVQAYVVALFPNSLLFSYARSDP